MDESLNTYHLPKLKPEDISNSKRPTLYNEIKAAIKSLPSMKSPGPERFTAMNEVSHGSLCLPLCVCAYSLGVAMF